MSANWIKDYDPDHLCEKLEESKAVGDDGRVSFQGFGFSQYIVVLNSMVELNKTIPELEKRRITLIITHLGEAIFFQDILATLV